MKIEKTFWLQDFKGRAVPGALYRSDIAAKIKLAEEHINGNVVGIKLYERSKDKASYTVQFIINTEERVPTTYENKEEMLKEYKNNHSNKSFKEGKLFEEEIEIHSGPELQFNPNNIKKEKIDE